MTLSIMFMIIFCGFYVSLTYNLKTRIIIQKVSEIAPKKSKLAF